MRTDNKIVLIVVALLVAYIIYMQSCKGGRVEKTTVVETVYKFDTIDHFFPVYTPTNVYTQLPNETISISYLDSNYCKRIAIDYLSTRYYSDTLSNDSVDLYSFAEVTNNKIVKQRSGYRLKFPVAVTNIVQENRVKVYLGGTLGSDFKNQLYFGPQLSLTDKRDNLYQVGAAFSPFGGSPIYSFGFGFKLKFKKK